MPLSPWLAPTHAVRIGAFAALTLIGAVAINLAMPDDVAAPETDQVKSHVLAIGPVIVPKCKKAAHRYLRDPSYAVPPNCWDSYYFHALGITPPGGGAPLPPDDGGAPQPDEPAPPSP